MLSVPRHDLLGKLIIVSAVFVLLLSAGSLVFPYSGLHDGAAAVPNVPVSSPAQAASINNGISYFPARLSSSQARNNLGPATSGCGASGVCGNLTYHNGPVMHDPSEYLIFWLPSGYSFDNPTIDPTATNPSDSSYEQLITRYFSDVCNSNSFYGIIQQYPDSHGPAGPCSLAGQWVDRSNYPGGRGSSNHPLTDLDIQNEVLAALSSNTAWSSNNGNSAFFVFTGYGVCSSSTGCPGDSYCAYHYWFTSLTGSQIVYANMPDMGNLSPCQTSTSPNSDLFADSEINLASHEQFEAFTDPTGTGWFYQDTAHEIGDECAWIFDSTGTTLLIGADGYRIQNEWSNRSNGCTSQGFGCAATLPATDSLGCDGLGPTTIGLTWGQSIFGTVFTDYRVQQSTFGPNGPWTTMDTISSVSNTTDYFANLSPNTTYWWQVAYDNQILSTTTNVVDVTQPSVARLSYVQSPDTTYKFAWNNNANYAGSESFESYQLEESVNGSSYAVDQTISSPTTLDYTVILATTTAYSFYLVTTDQCSTCSSPAISSTNSNVVNFTSPELLTAAASVSPVSADARIPVTFSCNAAGGVGPYSYSWSIGDGTTATTQIVTHAYAIPGTMIINCTVTDSLQSTALGITSATIFADPTVTIASRGSADIGQNVTFIAQTSGGSGLLTYDWTYLPAGCTARNSPSISCMMTTIRTFPVSVSVTDSDGLSAISNVLLFVVHADPSITAAYAVPASLDLGQETSITVTAQGGYAPLSYSYTGLPPGCTSRNTPLLTCTSTTAGAYVVNGTVTDQNGFSLMRHVFIVVNLPPAATIMASPPNTDINKPVTFLVYASQGTGHYSYSYQGLPPGCSNSNSTSLPCIPTRTGIYQIKVTVTDSTGVIASSTIAFTVSSDLTITTFTSLVSNVIAGQPTTFKIYTTGGASPLSYVYSGLPPGCASADSATVSCTPTVMGTYRVRVIVTDQAGENATSYTTITVAPYTVLGVSPILAYSAIGGVIAAGILAIVVAVVLVRRKGSNPGR